MLTGSIVLEHPQAAELDWEILHGWCAEPGQGPFHLRFRRRWPLIWRNLLAPFHSQSGLMTPYDTVLEWFTRLDVEARFPEARTFLRRLWKYCTALKKKALLPCPRFSSTGKTKAVKKKCPCPKT